MTLQSTYLIAEIAAAIAVIISLVYLAIQVRSNTKALKASASFEATHSWANTNEAILGDEKLIQLAIKAYDPKTLPDGLSDVERARMALVHRALFQKLEGQYYLHKYGYLEPEIWKMRRDWASGLVELPVLKDWWKTELEQSIFTSEFINALSSGDAVSVVIAGATTMATEENVAEPG
jgi:hypothetical protein